MAAQDDQDRRHPASDRQREAFAKRGDIARSRDLVAAMAALATALALAATGAHSAHLLVMSLRGATGALHRPQVGLMLAQALATFLRVFAPVAAAALAATALTAVVQGRGRLALRPLSFDWSRLDVFAKLAQLLSPRQGAVNLLSALVKVVAVGSVGAALLSMELPRLWLAAPASLAGALRPGSQLVGRLLSQMLAALVALGLADYGLAWWRLERRMRMSAQELRDELRDEAGDPGVRARRRRTMRQLVKQRSLAEVKKADVVLVNPSHVAVALKYDTAKMAAPKVVAKGADAFAERIRALARKHGVPVVSQPPLARLLFRQVPVGKAIPVELYQAVAVVLAHVFRIRRRGA